MKPRDERFRIKSMGPDWYFSHLVNVEIEDVFGTPAFVTDTKTGVTTTFYPIETMLVDKQNDKHLWEKYGYDAPRTGEGQAAGVGDITERNRA